MKVPIVGLTEPSMSSTTRLGGSRSRTRSIRIPDRSARAARCGSPMPGTTGGYGLGGPGRSD